MKYFYVEFRRYTPSNDGPPFVHFCYGYVGTDVDHIQESNIRAFFDYAHRFAFIECRETPANYAERGIEKLRPEVGRHVNEAEVRLTLIDRPINEVNAQIDAVGKHSLKLIYYNLPNGSAPLSLTIVPSSK